MFFFSQVVCCMCAPSLLVVGIPWRLGGIWMHNLRYYVGSGDVPEQIQFDGGTYTCRCGQKSAKFWLMILQDCVLLLLLGNCFFPC